MSGYISLNVYCLYVKIKKVPPVFPNPLLALKQENLVVVAVSYSLRMDSAALTSFTNPEVSENCTSNAELTVLSSFLLSISIVSNRTVNNHL